MVRVAAAECGSFAPAASHEPTNSIPTAALTWAATRPDYAEPTKFPIDPTLPADLRVGLFAEAKSYKAWVRTSSASDKPQSDTVRDVRVWGS